MLQAPAFVATVPYHVLIMLLIWPLFAWMYFRKRRPATSQEESRQTLRLAILWLISAMVVDFVGFVLIKNAWSMTPHELYVEYQPWITLIYISIFSQPLDSLVAFAMAHSSFQQTARFNFVKTCFRTSED